MSVPITILESDSGPILPSWLPRSASDFRELVIEVVAVWIVEGILTVIGTVGQAILTAADQLFGALRSAGRALLRPFGAAGDAVLAGVASIDTLLVSLATASGPFSPLVVAGAFAVMLLLGFVSVRAVIELVRFI